MGVGWEDGGLKEEGGGGKGRGREKDKGQRKIELRNKKVKKSQSNLPNRTCLFNIT